MNRGRTAFTLVEVLITLLLAVMIFSPIYLMLSHGSIRAYRGSDRNQATIYASDVIEIIRGAPYDAFPPDDKELSLEDILKNPAVFGDYDAEGFDPRFRITARVSPLEGYDPNKLKKVLVEVAWKSRLSRKGRKIVMCTICSPRR